MTESDGEDIAAFSVCVSFFGSVSSGLMIHSHCFFFVFGDMIEKRVRICGNIR